MNIDYEQVFERRAAAEGLTRQAVKKAIEEVLPRLMNGGVSHPNELFSDADLAADVGGSTKYVGGYMYARDSWSGIAGLDGCFERVCSRGNNELRTPETEARYAERALELLRTAPVGTVVYHEDHYQNKETRTFVKGGKGWVWVKWYRESEEQWEQNYPERTPGIPQAVAKRLGMAVSATLLYMIEAVM